MELFIHQKFIQSDSRAQLQEEYNQQLEGLRLELEEQQVAADRADRRVMCAEERTFSSSGFRLESNLFLLEGCLDCGCFMLFPTGSSEKKSTVWRETAKCIAEQ